MNYEVVQSISVQDGKVYINVARSGLSAMIFRESEDTDLTVLYQTRGLHAVLKALGEKVFLGTVLLRPHNCHLVEYMQQANDLIQQPLRLFLDADHAGEFIATVTEHLYTETMYSPVDDLRKLESLRSDPKATLEICKKNPRAFNFSEINVRRDRTLAKRYIRQCALHPQFVFPSYFVDDADMAMTALKIDGRLFCQLSRSLRNNRHLARYAYNSRLKRVFHANDPVHLGNELLEDPMFLKELCAICSDLDAERTPCILQHPGAAKEWLLHNQDAFANKHLLPRETLQHTEVLKALYSLAGNDPARLADVSLFIFQAKPSADSSL